MYSSLSVTSSGVATLGPGLYHQLSRPYCQNFWFVTWLKHQDYEQWRSQTRAYALPSTPRHYGQKNWSQYQVTATNLTERSMKRFKVVTTASCSLNTTRSVYKLSTFAKSEGAGCQTTKLLKDYCISCEQYLKLWVIGLCDMHGHFSMEILLLNSCCDVFVKGKLWSSVSQ